VLGSRQQGGQSGFFEGEGEGEGEVVVAFGEVVPAGPIGGKRGRSAA
jgi:hypothetical protein